MNLNLPFLSSAPRVAVIRLAGAIGAVSRFGTGLNDEALAPVIERAFRAGKPKAVALIINSPGGSPVQSSLIGARIRRLAEKTNVPVHAFVEDLAASGGYWLACTADDIWVDASSVVGSIGVISASFGFSEFIARQGVERRVHTAGKSKSLWDPFQPEKPEDVERLRAILEPVHANFKDHVRERRSNRLAGEVDLFQGDVWVGAQAVDVGLADGIGHVVPKLKDLYGDKVRLVLHGPRRSMFRRFGIAGGAASAIVGATIDTVEERAAWGRYGL